MVKNEEAATTQKKSEMKERSKTEFPLEFRP